MNNEVWKDIEGYEGKYKVSSLGKVKSLERYTSDTIGRKRKIKEKFLEPTKNIYGYYRVVLSKHGKQKGYRVHRLVAKMFIENPQNLPQVNHINGKKTDNRVENLEWITNRDNVIHAYKNGLKKVIRIPKKELEELYEVKKMPIKKISKIEKVSQGTIRKLLIEYGIKVRSRSEAQMKFDIKKEFLRELLKNKTVKEISKEIGCSYATVSAYKKEYNL